MKIKIEQPTSQRLQNAHSVLEVTNAGHSPQGALHNYSHFLGEVTSAFTDIIQTNTIDNDRVHHLLNGGASQALQAYVDRGTRVEFGMFFSGHRLATEVAKLLHDKLLHGAVLADPACGAGDLLLACLSLSPIHRDIHSTIEAWGKRVIGLDIHKEMAATTRARIALLAATRVYEQGNLLTNSIPGTFDLLSRVQSGNYFAQPEVFRDADCVVMNPPFTEIDSPINCSWSTGKVQQAAVFTDAVVAAAKINQEIVAVLPDVLRSGTRYSRWRQLISESADILNINVFGRFDSKTDVDVFIIHLRKREPGSVSKGIQWPRSEQINQAKVMSDLFKVSVGAVVPHRHKHIGQWVPYVDVGSAPANTDIENLKSRRFTGTLHKGPFIALRRTSSPSDRYRAVGSLIKTSDYIAVENHLIVLQPHDGTLKSCRKLMHLLRRDYVNEWLNATIRCRHLTTKVINELPILDWT